MGTISGEEFFQWLVDDQPPPVRGSKELVLVKKVCMLGEPGVGKTSLIRRFVFDVFDDKYIETIGAKVTKKEMRVQYTPTGQYFLLRMMIWDIAGHGALDFVKPSYYRDAEGAILICDVTRRSTLDKLEEWIRSVYNVTGAVPVTFFVNKTDLQDQAQFTTADLQPFMKKYNAPYVLTSARNGVRVEEGFRTLGMSLIKAFLR